MRKIKVLGMLLIMSAFAAMAMGSGSSGSTQSVKIESEADGEKNADGEAGSEKASTSDEVSYEITDTSFDYYTNSIGSVEYYGYVEITNTGSNNIYLDKAVFDLEDNDGHLLQSDDFVSRANLVVKPGEKGYFYNGLGSNLIDEGVSLDNGVNLVPQITIKKATGEPQHFEVTDTDLRPDNLGLLKVTGRIENNTDEDVNYVDIDVIFYDADGKVLAITATSATDLTAGNKVSFECSTAFANDKISMDNIASYDVIVEDMYMQF